MKKTNKTFKRFAAITSASLLAACAIAPVAFNAVAATDFTLTAPTTLPDDSKISNVKAFKIFSGEYKSDTNTFNVTGWADGVTGTTLGMDSTISAAAAAEAISALSETELDALAKTISTNLGSGTGITGTYDAENSKVKFASDLGVGYYLVLCDVTNTSDEDVDTYTSKSLGMLTVTGTTQEFIGEDGNAKVGLPEVIKKVKENSSIEAPAITINGKSFEADRTAEYNDVADYDIGDKVPFKLYGSLPVDLANYDTYYYKFTDTLGNEFGEASNYTVSVVNDGVSTPLANAVEITDADGTRSHTNYTYQKVSSTDNDFTITFNDVKNLLDAYGNKITVNSDSIITVDYTAELLETAAIGLPGQRNSVNLTYSNNPNNSGVGNNENGVTPNDEVIVFTYEIDVTKKFKDAADNDITVSNDIKNAVKFELRTDKDDATTAIKFSEKKTGDDTEYYYTDEDGTITKLSLYDLTNSQFKIHGLDKGTYYLVETDWPDEYNQAGATTIEVKAVTNNAEEWDDSIAYSALTGWGTDVYGNTTDEDKDSIAEATVINKKGTTLPGTGGIGTTIFYLGGGAMAAIGGIYLISKRRMKKSEE